MWASSSKQFLKSHWALLSTAEAGSYRSGVGSDRKHTTHKISIKQLVPLLAMMATFYSLQTLKKQAPKLLLCVSQLALSFLDSWLQKNQNWSKRPMLSSNFFDRIQMVLLLNLFLFFCEQPACLQGSPLARLWQLAFPLAVHPYSGSGVADLPAVFF